MFPEERRLGHFRTASPVLANTQNPEAARAFIDFLISREGQEMAASQGYMPAHPDVTAPEGFPALSEIEILPLDRRRLRIGRGRQGDVCRHVRPELIREWTRLAFVTLRPFVSLRGLAPGKARIWFDNEGGFISALVFVAVLVFLPAARRPAGHSRIERLPSRSRRVDRAADEPLGHRGDAESAWPSVRPPWFLRSPSAEVVALVLATMALANKGAARLFFFVLSLMGGAAKGLRRRLSRHWRGRSSPILETRSAIAPALGTPNPMLGFGGVIFVMGLHHAPLVAIVLASGLARVPKALIEAAMLDGARPLAIITQVILPVIRLNILSAVLLAFVAGVGNFGIPALLGLPVGVTTLPTTIYRQLASFGRGGINDAAMISLLIALIAGIAVIASAWLTSRHTVRTDVERGMEALHSAPGSDSPDGNLRLALFFAATILLPLASLVAKSLVPAYGVTLGWDTLTFAQYTDTMWSQALIRRAFANSFTYAGRCRHRSGRDVSARCLRHRSAAFLGACGHSADDRDALCPAGPWVVAIACILLFVNPLPFYRRHHLRHGVDHRLRLSRIFPCDRPEAGHGGGYPRWSGTWRKPR